MAWSSEFQNQPSDQDLSGKRQSVSLPLPFFLIPTFPNVSDRANDDLIFFRLYFNIICHPSLFKNQLWDA